MRDISTSFIGLGITRTSGTQLTAFACALGLLRREGQADHDRILRSTCVPNASWDNIVRMRNLVAHQRDKVNDDLMFVTLRRDIPALIKRLGPVRLTAGNGSRRVDNRGPERTVLPRVGGMAYP